MFFNGYTPDVTGGVDYGKRDSLSLRENEEEILIDSLEGKITTP